MTFASNAESVATVTTAGLVTGVAAGSAKITASTTDGLTDEVTITVVAS